MYTFCFIKEKRSIYIWYTFEINKDKTCDYMPFLDLNFLTA